MQMRGQAARNRGDLYNCGTASACAWWNVAVRTAAATLGSCRDFAARPTSALVDRLIYASRFGNHGRAVPDALTASAIALHIKCQHDILTNLCTRAQTVAEPIDRRPQA